MVKIKIIKETQLCKVGDVVEASKKSAKSYVDNGYAEYVEEPKIETKEDIEKLKKKSQELMDKRKEAVRKINEERDQTSTAPDDVKDYLIYSAKWNTYFVNVDKIADELIDEESFKTIFGKKHETIWAWDGKIYKTNGREIIKTRSEIILSTFAKTKVINEILEKIKRLTSVDVEEFDKIDTNLIPLNNGVYNIKTKKLEEHKPEYNFKFIIPIDYSPAAQCPNFLKFINETIYPEDIPVVQEWYGFCLYREYFIKKSIIGFGDKDTGKSVFLDTLISFVGEKNKSGVPLQKIARGSDFTKLSLKNKMLNAYDDLSSNDLEDGGGFKVATGGGYISGEEKFGDYSQFKCFAKQIFMANKIPPVKDNDDMAYFSRWMPIRFDNMPTEIDPFLRDKIINPKEMSGILNWALQGLYRLLKNGKFSYTKTPEQIKTIMEMSGNPLVAFAYDVLDERDKGRITKEEMFDIYSLWARENDRPRLSKEQLGRQLPIYIKYLTAKKDKERFWDGGIINNVWKSKKKCQRFKREVGTLDTFKKSYSNPTIYRGNDIILKKVSKPSIDKVSILKPYEFYGKEKPK